MANCPDINIVMHRRGTQRRTSRPRCSPGVNAAWPAAVGLTSTGSPVLQHRFAGRARPPDDFHRPSDSARRRTQTDGIGKRFDNQAALATGRRGADVG